MVLKEWVGPSTVVTSRLANMNSRSVQTLLIAVGAIALAIGLLFAGQGAGLIGGSSMTGSQMWLYIGLVLAVVGIVLLVLGIRRSRRGRSSK